MTRAASSSEFLDRGRRLASRTYLFDEVLWRPDEETGARRGVLVGASDTGVAMITEHQHTPGLGTRLVPSGRGHDHRWERPVSVIRVEQLSDKLDLVAAKYGDSSSVDRS